MNGTVRSVFCAIRPPGHHAEPTRAMGFCFFNNVAIGARYFQKRYGLRKILIVDWDVHHGNGTQEAFYKDPSVLFFSAHQYPFYPGTGGESEQGLGAGLGSTINVPMRAGSGDKEYIEAFNSRLIPAAKEFEPDAVLISAGFDAHRNDSLANMRLTEEGYAQLSRIVKGIAEEYAGGRIISCLEGGYHLESIAKSIYRHIQVLMET
jgi:acetoin utilization deacetylase AcuC-like enzyme